MQSKSLISGVEADVVIYCSVISDGTTGKEWISRLERSGSCLVGHVKSILLSSDFQPTSGVSYKVVLIKGALWKDNNRIIKNIRSYATEKRLLTPSAEVACLIMEKFSNKEFEDMGLYRVIVMHEPIKDPDGHLRLFNIYHVEDRSGLGTNLGEPDSRLINGEAVIFVVSETKS